MGWRSVSDTRGVNRFQGRGRAVEIPCSLHAAPPEAHMERTTFYQTHFPGVEIRGAETQKPIVRKDMLELSSSKVEGASVYARDFPKYTQPRSAQPCPNATHLHSLPGRVESVSSYASQFAEPRPTDRTEPIVRPDNLHPFPAKFQQRSVTGSDFQ